MDKRHSMPPTPSIPRGWSEEVDEEGDVFYVNENTNEKVCSSNSLCIALGVYIYS